MNTDWALDSFLRCAAGLSAVFISNVSNKLIATIEVRYKWCCFTENEGKFSEATFLWEKKKVPRVVLETVYMIDVCISSKPHQCERLKPCISFFPANLWTALLLSTNSFKNWRQLIYLVIFLIS